MELLLAILGAVIVLLIYNAVVAARLRRGPAGGGGVVGLLRLDPAFAAPSARRARFQNGARVFR